MHTEHDVKINGGGDCTALRDELKTAIMELTDKQLDYVLRRLQCLNEEKQES